MRTNKYAGKCHGCGQSVDAHAGILERNGRKWVVWCEGCFDKSDHSSYEDRACGDRAYEDRCASQVAYYEADCC